MSTPNQVPTFPLFLYFPLIWLNFGIFLYYVINFQKILYFSSISVLFLQKIKLFDFEKALNLEIFFHRGDDILRKKKLKWCNLKCFRIWKFKIFLNHGEGILRKIEVKMVQFNALQHLEIQNFLYPLRRYPEKTVQQF